MRREQRGEVPSNCTLIPCVILSAASTARSNFPPDTVNKKTGSVFRIQLIYI